MTEVLEQIVTLEIPICGGVVLLPTHVVFQRHTKQSLVGYVLHLRRERVPLNSRVLQRRIRLSVLLTRPCRRTTGLAGRILS